MQAGRAPVAQVRGREGVRDEASQVRQTLEIDHIISLKPGGSDDIANLFPEKRDGSPDYKVKDKLEKRLHDVVCTEHTMTLREVQTAIAKNWETPLQEVYGVRP
jgi:hypothetical protein